MQWIKQQLFPSNHQLSLNTKLSMFSLNSSFTWSVETYMRKYVNRFWFLLTLWPSAKVMVTESGIKWWKSRGPLSARQETMIILKGKFLIFYNLLTAPKTVSNTYAQVTRTQSCANHVQHMRHSSHAVGRVFKLLSFYLFLGGHTGEELKPSTHEGGEVTEVPRENPWQQASGNVTY